MYLYMERNKLGTIFFRIQDGEKWSAKVLFMSCMGEGDATVRVKWFFFNSFFFIVKWARAPQRMYVKRGVPSGGEAPCHKISIMRVQPTLY